MGFRSSVKTRAVEQFPRSPREPQNTKNATYEDDVLTSKGSQDSQCLPTSFYIRG